jgi:YD repeat-containing protein
LDKQYHPQELSNAEHEFVSSISGKYESFEYFTDPLARRKKQIHPDATFVETVYEPDDSQSSGYDQYSCTGPVKDEGWIDIKDYSNLNGDNVQFSSTLGVGIVLDEGAAEEWLASVNDEETAMSLAAAIEALVPFVDVADITALGGGDYRIELEDHDAAVDHTVYMTTSETNGNYMQLSGATLTGGNPIECDATYVSEGYARKFLKVINENSDTTRTEVDKFGHTLQAKSALGTPDSLTSGGIYDLLGNVTKILPPNYYDPRSGTSSTHWDNDTTKYNTLGQVYEAYTTDEGLVKYIYDNAGNLRYSQNAYQAASGSNFTVYYYDPFGRVTLVGEELDDFNWTSSPPSVTNTTYGTEASEWKTKYYYDTNYVTGALEYGWGRLTKTEVNDDTDNTAEHVTRYVYDKYGNITEKHIQIDEGGPLSEKVISHSYDLLGRETELVYPSGNVVVYQYDEVGRLKKIYMNN